MSNKPLVKHLLQLANAAFEQRIISRRGVVGRIVCFDLVMDFRYVLPCLVFCHRKCILYGPFAFFVSCYSFTDDLDFDLCLFASP